MIVAIVDDDESIHEHARRWTESFGTTPPDREPISLQSFLTDQDFLNSIASSKTSIINMIVLLDLDIEGNKKAGLKTLIKIRSSEIESIRKLPIIIYSNTNEPAEIDKSYLEYANSFVWKGNGADQKARFIETIEFWNNIVSRPNSPT